MKTRIAFLVTLAALFQAATDLGRTSSATPQQTGTAVLSVASGFATQPGAVDPLAGKTMVLFKESFESFLRRKGMFQSPPGSSARVSPLAAWAYACTTQSPVCQQALYEARPNSVSEAKADPSGKATLSGVPAATYYLFAITVYNKKALVDRSKTVRREKPACRRFASVPGNRRTPCGKARRSGRQHAISKRWRLRLHLHANRPPNRTGCKLIHRERKFFQYHALPG
jgi:hypothetical protein